MSLNLMSSLSGCVGLGYVFAWSAVALWAGFVLGEWTSQLRWIRWLNEQRELIDARKRLIDTAQRMGMSEEDFR